MDVKFITVRKANINTVPVVDGQVIAVTDYNAFYYDMNSKRYLLSAVHVNESLSGVGQTSDIYVINDGDSKGIYVWSDDDSSYHLIANENTDKFLSLVLDRKQRKIYLTGTDGNTESDELYYTDTIYVDFRDGILYCETLEGKSRDAYHADEADFATRARNSTYAEESEKLGHVSVGNKFKPIYLYNGIPSVCEYMLEADVPADAKFTDTTYTDFVGATDIESGEQGLVPEPSTSDVDHYLKGDGTWAEIVQSDMVGCTNKKDGKRGIVPTPVAGEYNSFLKGDGTWASYSAGYGLELVSLTFNLTASGVTPGTYGPIPNSNDHNYYAGEYIPVPRISVDKYGRITNIVEVPCYFTHNPQTDVPTLMMFSQDEGDLLVTYDDPDTALASFYIDDYGHLIAQYNYEDTNMDLKMDDNGHVILVDNNE